MGYRQRHGRHRDRRHGQHRSRLEAAAKEFDADLVISEAAAKLSGLDFSAAEQREIDIRGRARPLGVFVVARGIPIPAPKLPQAAQPKPSRQKS